MSAHLLSRCERLARVEQERLLEAEAPELIVWTGGKLSVGPAYFFLVTTWSVHDREAFDQYRGGQGERYIALLDWFRSQDEIREASGHAAGCLQSPVLVVLDGTGGVTWSGEGYLARMEVARRFGAG